MWVLVALLASGAWLARDRILRGLGGYLVSDSPPEKADIAVVLAGDPFGHRIIAGGGLVERGYVPVALVSGPGGEFGFHECDLAIPFAVNRGFKASDFAHFENEARSTEQEAAAIVPELRRRGVHKVLLVTSNYHTRRAGAIFRRAAPELSIITIAAPDEFYRPQDWWHNREGQKTFLMEWEKTVWTWFRR